MKEQLYHIIQKPISIAPLVTFRILFGALMAFGAIRFWTQGWIEELFIKPGFFFKFYGFEWVTVPEAPWIYLLFGLVILSALGIMLGLFYRLSAVLFLLSFTYTELLDATNYLNHYYLVCLLAFLLIFLPANRSLSLDVWRKPSLKVEKVPAWCINILIFQLSCVYFFAGLAKLNADWLFRAMPMAVWLPERTDFPILGYFFQFKWVAFAFSWAGALYDLTIAFFLLNKKTRPYAYFFVLVFHLLTNALFNIGLFPLIMITSTLIFFSADWHERLQAPLKQIFSKNKYTAEQVYTYPQTIRKLLVPLFGLYMLLQVILPLRHWLYAGNTLWTEEGYRFSWRVMLVEKSGLVTFRIKDSGSDRQQEIVNGNHLTLFQEKQMSIQPDFILQFAHFLKTEYETRHGFRDPVITAEAHVALNGRTSRPFVDPKVDLTEIRDSFAPKTWILK